MNDTITIEEFLDHMQFSENRKKAASAVNVNYEHWTEDHAERVTEMTIFGPEIRYKTNLGHSYIQLKFIDEKNADYRRLSYFLSKYEADMDDYAANEGRKDFPALIITIVPTYYEGRYYMTCVNLLMFRTYKDDTGAYIELLFENKSFTINETDQIDLSAINQQIKKEEEAKAYFEQKYWEEKEYEKEREEKRAELRKKKQRERGR